MRETRSKGNKYYTSEQKGKICARSKEIPEENDEVGGAVLEAAAGLSLILHGLAPKRPAARVSWEGGELNEPANTYSM